MRTTRLSALACLAGLALAAGAAAEDARTLVVQAVGAQGGETPLARRTAVVTKVCGTFTLSGEETAFTGEVSFEPPERSRVTLEAEAGGGPVRLTLALDGGHGWRAIAGRVEDLDAAALADLQRAAYAERVVSLLPLLHDSSFTLTRLGERKVRGVPATAVKVSAAGRPDVVLCFDRSSHLLLKSEYRENAPDGKGKSLRETYYYDYREPDLGAADEATLKAAGIAVDGPGLLAFLRSQAPAPADPARAALLIRRLGDDVYAVREKAAADLVALGGAAAPFLRQALRDEDWEIATRAQACLQRIGDPASPGKAAAALRLTAVRRPDGAAEVVLAFLCRTPDEGLAREAQATLAILAEGDGGRDPVLVRALEGDGALRRAAAEAALSRDGGAWLRQPGWRVYPAGIKLPMRAVTFADGKQELVRETLAVEYYNGFEDTLFARPAGKTKAKR
jgi:hypothetical protein